MLTASHRPASARARNRAEAEDGRHARSAYAQPGAQFGRPGTVARRHSPRVTVRSQRMGLCRAPGGRLPGMDRVKSKGFTTPCPRSTSDVAAKDDLNWSDLDRRAV